MKITVIKFLLFIIFAWIPKQILQLLSVFAAIYV